MRGLSPSLQDESLWRVKMVTCKQAPSPMQANMEST
jgi:hypothetical protein